MNRDDPKPGDLSPRDARTSRLREQLRANLLKRKAQKAAAGRHPAAPEEDGS